MRANLRANCVPERLLDGDVPAFDDYLEERRKLMAAKIRGTMPTAKAKCATAAGAPRPARVNPALASRARRVTAAV